MSMAEIFSQESITLTRILSAAVLAYIVYLTVKFVIHISVLKRTFGDVQTPEKHWLWGNMHVVSCS